jgi:hypothetical protein
VLLRERVPKGPVARDVWGGLPRKVRRQVVREAGRGRVYEDERVAAIAVGWAWQVLGPPEARVRVGLLDRLLFILDVVTTTAGSKLGVDVLDGSAGWDNNPYVRGRAKRIEAANPVAGGPTVT